MGSRPSEKRYRPRRDSGFNSFLPTLTLGGKGSLKTFLCFLDGTFFSQTPDSEICAVSPQVFGCNCRLVYSIESKTEVSPRHVVSACSNQGLGACTLRLATVHFKRFHLTCTQWARQPHISPRRSFHALGSGRGAPWSFGRRTRTIARLAVSSRCA